ncbi:Oxygen-independent coproporphyrinogen III oxidase (chromatophore) [Paulinella micropora]|uniref:Radical S-adenosyl methionine domain-containing protein 1, mitochondrial n=1 Tax=Paulinella micropora TaxID=1928728 RepID=A0A1L5YB22_9EUKA|nr:Oxygen-independent coproporphyrinogen III oxidase [Paulinella micropora]AQX44667.1 Oxygen-independent coproporphyrinogen III oxidase [Paulinella micropora]BBL85874.1 Oxygen-independent coproporphyrinogen III oxidase [Paulinella micropora]
MWEPRSAYLHIPFCHRRCYYCDFAIVPLGDHADGAKSDAIETYLELLEYEINSSPSGPPLSTVYIGGGTPSMLTPAQVDRIFKSLKSHFGIASGAELTLEMDPSTFDQLRFEGYLAAGINRVSLGVQSLDDSILLQLGRRHCCEHIHKATSWIREAFAEQSLISWSLDLIQTLPGQSLTQWRQQLKKAIILNPPHISIYNLSIEPGTVFERKNKLGQLNLPTMDEVADIMEATSCILSHSGYGKYEISNFAFPGHTSRHNRSYWSGSGWWGFGVSASSAPYGEILARPRKRREYIQWLSADRLKAVPLHSGGMPFDERLIVGLRRREGVALFSQARICDINDNDLKGLLDKWQCFYDMGLLIIDGDRWRLSESAGMSMSNTVLREMLVWWEAISCD